MKKYAERVEYCRKSKTKEGKDDFCGQKITKANVLNWCEECRKRLPFWES